MSKDTGKGVAAPKSDALAKTAEADSAVNQALSNIQVQEALRGLSQETIDKLSLELRETLHQITIPIDDKVKASSIFDRGDPFTIIDATTLEDYVDKRTGEVSDKHIFVLEFAQGDVQVIMQSDSGPRARLASLFVKARSLGTSAVAGPYKVSKKEVGQPQAALIFERQSGFQARVL